uniref:Peptidase S1 domain-containing protein n=1 Tax=Romanomermis culicivorax TaxID=13658 RepID=A0A915KKY1_ROMCU
GCSTAENSTDAITLHINYPECKQRNFCFFWGGALGYGEFDECSHVPDTILFHHMTVYALCTMQPVFGKCIGYLNILSALFFQVNMLLHIQVARTLPWTNVIKQQDTNVILPGRSRIVNGQAAHISQAPWQGDSGGPFACAHNGHFYLHGISSSVRTEDCMDPAFTNVPSVKPWIIQTINSMKHQNNGFGRK